jgi:hypothetical protein
VLPAGFERVLHTSQSVFHTAALLLTGLLVPVASGLVQEPWM